MASRAAYIKGDDQAKTLAAYAAEPLLDRIRNNIRRMKKLGFVIKGESRSSPQVVDLQLKGEPIPAVPCPAVGEGWTIL